jgi:alpha-tubulin suppressor-like RCC1 family protein
MEEGWIQVSNGDSHTLALDSQGRAWAWGNNYYGQLGIGLNDGIFSSFDGPDRNVPTLVTIPEGVGHPGTWIQVSAGQYHSLGIDSNGKAWAWGFNSNSQLGDGTTTLRNVPVAIDTGTVLKWKLLSAGSAHSLGISADEATMDQGYAWGNNGSGRTGLNTFSGDTLVPTRINTGTVLKWRLLSAGSVHSLGISIDPGILDRGYAWGDNLSGQLGIGSSTTWSVPRPISTGTVLIWKSLSAGRIHSLGISADEATLDRGYAWGSNTSGRLGTNTGGVSSPAAIDATDVQTWSQLSAGRESMGIALSPNPGKGWAWGQNFNGILGDGTTIGRIIPTEILTTGGRPQTWKQLSPGSPLNPGGHALGISADSENNNEIWAWGDNNLGQLGDGTTTNVTTGPKSIGYPPNS